MVEDIMSFLVERKPGIPKSLNLKDVVIPKINLSVAVCKALKALQ